MAQPADLQSLSGVLQEYNELLRNNPKNSPNYPMLVLSRSEGKVCLKIKSRNEFGFWETFAAWLGIGNASLVKVASYLRAHLQEINNMEDPPLRAMSSLNVKIQDRNSHSIRKIQAIACNRPIEPLIEGFVDHTWTDNPERHEIDELICLPELHIVGLSDGAMHGVIEERKGKHVQFVDEFKQWLQANLLLNYDSLEAACTAFHRMPEGYTSIANRIGITGSLILSQFITLPNGEKHIVYLAAGDSTLYKYCRATDTFVCLTPVKDAHGTRYLYHRDGDISRSGSKNRLVNTYPVGSGDLIIIVTDGVTDYMEGPNHDEVPKHLKKLLSQNSYRPGPSLMNQLKEWLLNFGMAYPHNHPEGVRLDPNNVERCDDFSIAIMEIP